MCRERGCVLSHGKGVPKSPEHRANISAALKGRMVHGLHKAYNFGGHRCAPLRDMSEAERAYVGAFIDTDGCVMRRKGTAYWAVSFVNMEIELIAALLRATGRGKVRLLPKHVRGQTHYVWEWALWCQREIRQLALACVYHSVKLQKVLKE